eukprot:COSAG02_NODE_36_length_48934_cov_144.851029_37_plen_79_part_00
MLIYRVVCEKKQRFEVIRGTLAIYQWDLPVLHKIPTQAVRESNLWGASSRTVNLPPSVQYSRPARGYFNTIRRFAFRD